MVLLSLDLSTIAPYFFGLLILALGIFLVVRHLRSKQGREELDQFLKEIETTVRTEIIAAITKINFKDMISISGSIEQAEIDLINSLYEKIWDLTLKHLDEMYADNPLYIIMKQNLTREFIMDFCDMIIQSRTIQQLIGKDVEAALNLDAGEELEEEYTKINEEIENDTYAEGEYIPPMTLEEVIPNPVEIIPPSEEDNYDDGEVVGEETEIVENNLAGAIDKED